MKEVSFGKSGIEPSAIIHFILLFVLTVNETLIEKQLIFLNPPAAIFCSNQLGSVTTAVFNCVSARPGLRAMIR